MHRLVVTVNTDMSTFAGFAPISNPRFALVVVISAPKAGKFYGGVVSGPVFRAVMSKALQLYNIKPGPREGRKELVVKNKSLKDFNTFSEQNL